MMVMFNGPNCPLVEVEVEVVVVVVVVVEVVAADWGKG